MNDDPTVKKIAEATKGGHSHLLTLWSDQVITECKPVDVVENEQPKREFECTESPAAGEVTGEMLVFQAPPIRFFRKLGKFEEEGYDVKVLYDSEGEGFSDVRTLMGR